jgi:hypothetical protein
MASLREFFYDMAPLALQISRSDIILNVRAVDLKLRHLTAPDPR